jgi:hypothetical protein
MKKMYLVIILCFIWSPLIQASILPSFIIKGYEGDESEKSVALLAVYAAGEALVWTNMITANRGGGKLFCKEPNFFGNGEQYYQIMKKEYYRNIEEYKSMATPLPIVLLTGLVADFPCKEKE